MEVSCFSCGTIEKAEQIAFRAECVKCGEDLHVCYNCRFYDESSYNECRENSADRITEKSRSNLCEYFSPGAGKKDVQSEKDQLLSAAEALFKK